MSTPVIAVTALGVALTMMTGAWLVSLVKRDASVIDVFWGLGFVVLAWFFALVTETATTRKLVVITLVTLWGMRLSLYILWRNWGKGEDHRYQEMRARNPETFPLRSLFTVFWLQAVLLWALSMPLLQAERSEAPGVLTWLDAIGILFFVVGFIFEAGGDWQLARFKADPKNRGEVLNRGFWRYTRHPNYFGDAMVWWGFFFFAAATPQSLWTLYSPVLMTFLLLRVSGVALLERSLQASKPAYREYVERTNAFLPWFPAKAGKDKGVEH